MTLQVLDAQFTVYEPDEGHAKHFSGCFSADIGQPLGRDAVFQLIIDANDFANLDLSVNIDSPFTITIPSSFSGEFLQCITGTLYGDNRFEDNRTIIIDVRPHSSVDSVTYVYPPNASSVVIDIIDNDPGK